MSFGRTWACSILKGHPEEGLKSLRLGLIISTR